MDTKTFVGAEEIVAEHSLLDQIMAKSNLKPADDGYDVARKGVQAFIAEILEDNVTGEPVNKARVDRMIAELDSKISEQMDEILHAPELQELEATWRGLKLLVDRTDFRENIKIELISASKEEVLEDFELSPEVPQSGLYKHVYAAGYGQFGGQPVGAMMGFISSTHLRRILSCYNTVPRSVQWHMRLLFRRRARNFTA